MRVTDEMVSRFLTWQLPPDFSPDGGIMFAREVGTIDGKRDRSDMGPSWWPVGTNLLTADQARAMLEHVLGGLPTPMTREFCAAYPGTAASIINALARQIDAASIAPTPMEASAWGSFLTWRAEEDKRRRAAGEPPLDLSGTEFR